MLIPADEVLALSEQVGKLEAPDRQVDAMVMRALMAHRVEKNPRICVLEDDRSAPLFMEWSEAPTERLMQRLERSAQENREDVLYFEHEGKWLHFVSFRVPHLTASLDACLTLRNRFAPDYAHYSVDSRSGTAELFSPTHAIRVQSTNKIPEFSLLSAILRVRYFKLTRETHERASGD